MGAAAFDQYGKMVTCDGGDVLSMLNDVFGDPSSKKFAEAAKAKDKFAEVLEDDPDNWQKLVAAYNAAKVPVGGGWEAYLRLLGTTGSQGPQNIYNIAQIRYHGLNDGVVMLTDVHEPRHGGHVHTQRGSKAGLHSQISSPCPIQS
jgi:hypothetical protein